MKNDERSRTPFAARLVKQRRANFLTQRDLAGKLGVTQAAVARWEIGRYTPALRYRKALADILNIAPSILFEGADDEVAA